MFTHSVIDKVIARLRVLCKGPCKLIGERAKRARHSQVCSIENRGYYIIIGERAKRARHSQVCSIENRGYIYILYIYSTCNFCSYNP